MTSFASLKRCLSINQAWFRVQSEPLGQKYKYVISCYMFTCIRQDQLFRAHEPIIFYLNMLHVN